MPKIKSQTLEKAESVGDKKQKTEETTSSTSSTNSKDSKQKINPNEHSAPAVGEPVMLASDYTGLY
jgi:hypothetical protein